MKAFVKRNISTEMSKNNTQLSKEFKGNLPTNEQRLQKESQKINRMKGAGVV